MSDPVITTVCAECDCNEEIRLMDTGEDMLTYCESCQSVEGRTREVEDEGAIVLSFPKQRPSDWFFKIKKSRNK